MTENLGTQTEPTPEKADPFDLTTLRLSQDFASQLGVKKVLTTVPIKKPDRHNFFRVHPSPEYALETALLDLKAERDVFLVAPGGRESIAAELTPKILYTAIDRQGNIFLWPVRLPGPDGRLDDWNQSSHKNAELAKVNWTRSGANMDAGHYDTHIALGDLPEPEWPDLSFQEIVKIAFRDKIIDSPDHPVLKRLRGEI